MNQLFTLTLSVITFLCGCAYRPIAIDQKQLFVGVFKSEQSEQTNCEYSSIQGIGIKLGLTTAGLGYFHRQTLRITNKESAYCTCPLGEVFVGDSAINAITTNTENTLTLTPQG